MQNRLLVAALLLTGTGLAQAQEIRNTALDYTYAELRFVDVDVADGSGLRLNGSYQLDNNWLIVGGLTQTDFDFDVDALTIEAGAGYVWPYNDEFDLVGTLRLVRTEVDTPFGSEDDTGFAFSAGTRGLLTSQFEIRGSVNHINVADSDTYIELGGDYHFTEFFSAGLTVEVAGDADVISLGARWFF